jgi:hypothetical protein
MRIDGPIRRLAFVTAAAAFLSFCAGGGKSAEAPDASAASEAPQEAAPEAPAQAANDPAATAPSGAAEGAYDPATALGSVKGVPAPGNTAPIEAVANFFTELPGFDVAALDAQKREKFLHRVNSEMCSCGCRNDTLAHCLVNDPKCPTVKGLVQTAYDEIKAGK